VIWETPDAERASPERNSSDAGRKSDFSESQEKNGSPSIRATLGPDSKAINDSPRHPEKELMHITSTNRGMQIDRNSVSEKMHENQF
jgi:hypothetical protein